MASLKRIVMDYIEQYPDTTKEEAAEYFQTTVGLLTALLVTSPKPKAPTPPTISKRLKRDIRVLEMYLNGDRVVDIQAECKLTSPAVLYKILRENDIPSRQGQRPFLQATSTPLSEVAAAARRERDIKIIEMYLNGDRIATILDAIPTSPNTLYKVLHDNRIPHRNQ